MTAAAACPPGLLTDAGRAVTFTFGDRTVTARAGQTIAAALFATGVRVFSRSFKYHRPRGLFCVAGDCPNCLMDVDGRPNVRTCVEPVREGQVVTHQNAWPSLDCDLLRTFDYLDRFLPVGFYYKRFHRPRWLWPIFEHTVRHVAGIGRIDVDGAPRVEADVEHLHAEVCVVGGGPAGMAAASGAAHAGASVLLLERYPLLGGHLLYDGRHGRTLEQLRGEVAAQPRIRVLPRTTVFGLYEGNLLGAFQGQRFLKVRARQVIVCAGGRQRPFVFHNNDLPGVFLGDGVLRLARLYGVLAGRRAVVLTDSDEGARLAAQLTALGLEVVALVDRLPHRAAATQKKQRGKRAKRPAEEKWPVLAPAVAVAALGGMHLRGVRVAQLNSAGAPVPGSEEELDCDLLCVASAPLPANELLLQGGMRFRFDSGRWLADRAVPGLRAGGLVAGTLGMDRQIMEGRLRGAEAAADLGYRTDALEPYRVEAGAWSTQALLVPGDSLLPHEPGHGAKRFVCLCEDVTEKDIAQAVAEGFDGIETLKRYTTVNMGPCQGKVCSQAAIEACARATRRGVAQVGTTTARPPCVPVELCVLAADRHYHPVRRTPLHHWHEAARAQWLDAGQWKRAESYGDPADEVRAVRQRAGLIDVSTLGKIEVVGPDAGELLDRVYLNRWSDLKPGRARYGILCNEDGVLFDDGVGARLGPEHFYLTATTGNAESVFGWLELWRATWRLNATVLKRTAALAAMNLAGPRAREVLTRLTELDVSAAAFPYMAMREATVAGVPCRVFRIGFVGEVGYEIHCPAAQAWSLWEALVQAGMEVGLRPFGVEAQRILRLEKGHLIIGQDTDALSTPLEAGLGGLVRFDKSQFIGKEPLLRLRAMPPRSRLVGFRMLDTDRSPPEGCQVVDGRLPVGRVTSARYSPTLGRSLGLAWVPATAAAPGERFFIRWDEADVPAVIVPLPFYDPKGERLRS
jgi:sarcosine oxidase subunit alpha